MEPLIKPTSPRPVMDIRPQRPAPALARSNFSAAVTAPVASTPAPSPAVAPQPVPTLSHQEDPGVQPTPDHFPASLPKVKTPFLAIFLAIVVGGSLIAFAVFGYNKSQNKTDTAANQGTTVESVTTEDVDSSVDDTEEALNALDETADFNAADLADDTLGL